MNKSLIDKSIKTALSNDWEQAVAINKEILHEDPAHIPTLNRLAHAYQQLGKIKDAIETYEAVLKHDHYNAIAKKYLEALKSGKTSASNTETKDAINLDFVEEPGKTKIVPLTRLGDPHMLETLRAGQIVQLTLKGRYVCVYTNHGDHVGALTDDVAYQLKSFLQAGNTYRTTIKSASTSQVTVFLRELSRAAEHKDTASLAI